MSLAMTYARPCYGDVKRARWRVAQRVCMAVAAHAQDGTGRIERIDPDDPSLVRVRAVGGYAIVRILENCLQVRRIFTDELLAPSTRFLEEPDPPSSER